MMGLLDKIAARSLGPSLSRRPRKGRKVDEGRGQKLLDTIEERVFLTASPSLWRMKSQEVGDR